LVFLTYTVFDDEVEDEVEKIEAIPCRRCAEEAKLSCGQSREDRTYAERKSATLEI
jgi:hypothetical protein